MTSEDDRLRVAALAVRERAHAPYSHFRTGVALLADDGNIYAGCNIENASYGLGNCAEASAIAAMMAGGGKRIRKLYVVAQGPLPVTPCGGCRQRLREFADLDLVVISHGLGGAPLETTLGQLLPHSLGPEYLT
jgi:cytidine deaminase